jgi:hypothetical protein
MTEEEEQQQEQEHENKRIRPRERALGQKSHSYDHDQKFWVMGSSNKHKPQFLFFDPISVDFFIYRATIMKDIIRLTSSAIPSHSSP